MSPVLGFNFAKRTSVAVSVPFAFGPDDESGSRVRPSFCTTAAVTVFDEMVNSLFTFAVLDGKTEFAVVDPGDAFWKTCEMAMSAISRSELTGLSLTFLEATA